MQYYQSEWLDTKCGDRDFKIPIVERLFFDKKLKREIAAQRSIAHENMVNNYDEYCRQVQNSYEPYRADLQKMVDEFIKNKKSSLLDCSSLQAQGIMINLECFITTSIFITMMVQREVISCSRYGMLWFPRLTNAKKE